MGAISSNPPKRTPTTLQYYIVALVIQPMFSVDIIILYVLIILYVVNECLIGMPYSRHLESDLVNVHGVCIFILH